MKIAEVILTDTHLKETNIEINKSVFEQSFQFCLENGLQNLYHLGDIFNSRKAQPLDVLQAFLDILDRAKELGLKIIIVPGNHDKTDYISRLSFLDPFATHPALDLITGFEQRCSVEGISISMIPFFADEQYLEWLEYAEKRKPLRDNDKRILFTHIGISGAVMNNGTVVDGIKGDLFDVYEKVFIGHYHDKQIFGRHNYIGSTIQHNYGEDPEKGLTILYDDLTFETKVLDYPKYHKIETSVKDLTLKDIEQIKQEIETSGDNIRIILTGDKKEIDSFNKNSLLTIGASVAIKQDEISKEEVEERAEPFTSTTLMSEYERFCEKNQLEAEVGRPYLVKALATQNQDRNVHT